MNEMVANIGSNLKKAGKYVVDNPVEAAVMGIGTAAVAMSNYWCAGSTSNTKPTKTKYYSSDTGGAASRVVAWTEKVWGKVVLNVWAWNPSDAINANAVASASRHKIHWATDDKWNYSQRWINYRAWWNLNWKWKFARIEGFRRNVAADTKRSVTKTLWCTVNNKPSIDCGFRLNVTQPVVPSWNRIKR